MNKKYTKEELLKMPAIEIYKLVLQGKERKIFPKGFWKQTQALENAKLCVQFMIEEILKWTDEDIKENLSTKIFRENRLSGMLQYVFNDSSYLAINSTYPNKFKEWEFKVVPQNFWTVENGIKATTWLIEEKLKWTDEDIKEKLSFRTFKKNNLGGMLQYAFNGSPYDAINEVYPNKLKQWELKSSVPRNYWTLENSIEVTKWLIEEKLKWTDEDIKEKLSFRTFRDNNLGGMFQLVFNGSSYDAINMIYPNRFKQWEFKSAPNNFWTLENGIETTKWLIEEKLKWTDEDIKEKLSFRVFRDNNLSGMFQRVFNSSSYDAINTIYPNKFKKEDLKSYQYNVTKNK